MDKHSLSPVEPTRWSNSTQPLRARSVPLLVQKVSSNPDACKPLTHSSIDDLLTAELNNAVIKDIPGLLEHIIPDTALPASPSNILSEINLSYPTIAPQREGPLQLKSLFDLKSTHRCLTEESSARLFNIVTACAAKAARLPTVRRVWTAAYCNKGLPGIRATRRPDVALFDLLQPLPPDELLKRAQSRRPRPLHEEKSHSFHSLRSTCQVKCSPTHQLKSRGELAQDAYFIFSAQCNRRFVLGISLCGLEAGLSYFDRAGALHSILFPIDQTPLLFIRLVVGLSLGRDDMIGYDTTISDGPLRHIKVEDTYYQIVETLFISDMIRGRGTICYRASRDGKDFVIKDIWANVNNQPTEVEILKRIAENGIQGVPVFEQAAVVKNGGRTDTTAWARSCIPSTGPQRALLPRIETREHRRIVMSPFAKPLYEFQSKIELLTALRDAILG